MKDAWVRLDPGKGTNSSGARRKIWVRDMGDLTDPPNIIFTHTGEHTTHIPTIQTQGKPYLPQWHRVPLRPGQSMPHAIAKVEKFYGLPPGYILSPQLDDDDVIE